MAHAQKTDFVFRTKRTSPFKSAQWVASVQWTAGSRGVRISCSNAGYTMFRDSVKSTGYPLHSPVSPSLPLPCVNVCHNISTGLYLLHISNIVICVFARCVPVRSCYIYQACSIGNYVKVTSGRLWTLSVSVKILHFQHNEQFSPSRTSAGMYF